MQSDLQTAIQDHESGRLSEAIQTYERLVSQNPGNPVVWNLLGVAAHQQGDHQRALECVDRAIALHPREASFHANMGEILRALGRYERAASCCQRALEYQPHFPGAANNLGLALQALGQIEPAISQFQAAIRMQPDFAMAHNNLGTALRQAGRSEEARVEFQQAIHFNPDLAAAHSNLGQLLLEKFQRQEALKHCLEAVRLQSSLPEAHNNLGNVLRELGRSKEAQACYTEALRLNPGLALTCNNMGQVFQEQGLLDSALGWYRRGLQLDPDSARILCNIGSLFQEREQYAIAIEHYDRALQLDPHYAEAYHGRGSILHHQEDLHGALNHFREALRIHPGYAMAHCSMGTVFEELGDFEQAEQFFREAMQLDRDHAAAYAQLATLLRGKLPGHDLSELQRLASTNMADGKRSAANFGLAHVHDALGNYSAAAEELTLANALSWTDRTRRGQQYDPVMHNQFVEGLIEAFTSAYFERVAPFGNCSQTPVFIIGLPRSGTTLAEQMLASHPQVFGAGELTLAGAMFGSLPQLIAAGSIGRLSGETVAQSDCRTAHATVDATPDWECVKSLDGPMIAEVANRYLAQLTRLNPSATRIVDKMPDNYLYLGLITTLFPNARIIHCRRDLRDIAVSCWMTNFRQIRWANRFDHIVGRFQAYRRLMDHWRRTLPVPILEIDYEETVLDAEAAARRLVDWIGLEWNPACAAFHEQRRPVRTASVAQVRQPVYRTSVARWKNYESALAPLFEGLPS
jgi:tetratricopeptide (TPR) repeat protein